MELLDFVKHIEEKYPERYIVDVSTWVDENHPLKMTCKKHGVFYRKPIEFCNGFVCPYESNILRKKPEYQKLAFLEKANKKFGGRFEYDMNTYTDSRTPMKIKCLKHGWFTQQPNNHLSGDGGCKECANEVIGRNTTLKKSMSTEEFIKRASEIHGDKYSYENVDMNNKDERGYVEIICKEHGSFWQNPQEHLKGKGCKLCGYKYRKRTPVITTEDFIARAQKVHGDKYIYDKIAYNGAHEQVEIICRKHGSFWQIPFDHFEGHGCSKCGNIESNGEKEVADYVKSLIGEENVVLHDRKILNGLELDIFIPSLMVGIEYNGLYWHSDKFIQDKNYHLKKLNECNSRGIKLIMIFEDEWLGKNKIVKAKIRHLLGKDEEKVKIPARKCVIKEISHDLAKIFLGDNHIQGFAGAKVHVGAFFNDKLVGVTSFLDEGYGKWNLTRMATDINAICQGVCSRMFKYFIKNYNPVEIKSFADKRWTLRSDNNIYTRLGFTLIGELRPDYRYVVGKERKHKFNLRKNVLISKYNMDSTLTETEMIKKLGLNRIYDCGLMKFVWQNE